MGDMRQQTNAQVPAQRHEVQDVACAGTWEDWFGGLRKCAIPTRLPSTVVTLAAVVAEAVVVGVGQNSKSLATHPRELWLELRTPVLQPDTKSLRLFLVSSQSFSY